MVASTELKKKFLYDETGQPVDDHPDSIGYQRSQISRATAVLELVV